MQDNGAQFSIIACFGGPLVPKDALGAPFDTRVKREERCDCSDSGKSEVG